MKPIRRILMTLFIISLQVMIFISCKKKPDIPLVSTENITEITQTSGVSGGNVTSDGGAEVTARGVCWSTTQNPTTADNKTSDGSGTGSFTSNITGLTPNTLYHVRAYATNSTGTGYGNEVSFTTSPVILATVTTAAVTSVTSISAVSGGNVTNTGGGSVTARGVCWNTTGNPVVTESHTSDGTGSGTFTSNLTGLSSGTTYYVRAYATNSAGTAYGDQVTFITPVSDVEGNIYKTIKIGDQVWMAENLMTTRYNDNTSISQVTNNTTWSALSSGAYCWYNNNIAYKSDYGALYNWFAVNTDKLCPVGWHVPTNTEWTALFNYLINSGYGYNGTANIGKALASTSRWRSWSQPGYVGNDISSNNSSGFSALPGGHRYAFGNFSYIEETGFWWSSNQNNTESAYARDLEYCMQTPSTNFYDKNYGLSVRCIKNGTTR